MRILVIGYGNPSRRDDGVALVVINGLRRRLGVPLFEQEHEGWPYAEGPHGEARSETACPEGPPRAAQGAEGAKHGPPPAPQVDTLFVQQLTPELAETLAGYDRVYFLDAHVGPATEMIRRAPLQASPDRSLVSHHMKPTAVLALVQRLYGRCPVAELISVRGFAFDFGSALSPQTATAAQQVIDELWQSVVEYSTPM